MGNALSVQGEPMSSDLVAEGSTLTMDLLPLDVQFQIFLGISELHNYEDAITAIQNLALASKAWYAVFQRHKGLIYRNVALQMMSVKTIRAAKASYFCNFNELTWATTVMQRVIASLRSEAPSDAGLLKENTWTAPMIRSMMRKQRTFRCTAVKIALVSLPEGARDEPTFSELDRIERAIYHTELFFWAQEIRMRFVVSLYPNSPLPHDRIPGWVRSDEAFNDMFTREFSVLEMEQVRCFITILLQHETYYYNMYGTNDIRVGLSMDRLIEFPNEALAGRLLQVNYEQALKHFLDIDMSQHTLWDLHFGEDVDWLDEDIAVQIQNHPEDRPAINAIQTLKGQASQSLLREILHSRPEACRDDDEGPNRMWLHVHRGLTDMNELDCRLLAFRLYGYVFWDNDHAERAITHRNLYSIPYFIRHTNAVYGAPAFGHFAEENRAMGPARAARVVLLDAGHRGRFDFQRFFADSMADNDEITDLTHALHYHPPSAQTCRACAAMDRGDWREEELQLHRAEEVIINGVQVLHIN